MRWPLVFLLGAACATAVFLWVGRGIAPPIPPAGAGTAAPATSLMSLAVAAPLLPRAAPVAQDPVPGAASAVAAGELLPAGASSQVEPAVPATAPRPEIAAGQRVAEGPAGVDLPLSMAQAHALNGLLIPVAGVQPGDLTDTFTQARGAGRVHDAIDIMAARGTPVLAANDGHVVKLFTSVPGGLTVYQFDADDQVIYYYAHLDSYAPGLAEGQVLHRGDPIGFVGSTGNASADAPHLHFEVQLLGPEKQWWHATSVNPYGRFEGQ